MNNGNGALRLNIGSGDAVTMKGYTNVDAKFGDSAFPLKYGDNTVDEIYASHILEHFGFRQTLDVLKDWVRALKPGGVLKVAVPDFSLIARCYAEKGYHWLADGYVYGDQLDDTAYHKALFDESKLRTLMESAGLSGIQRWESEVKDCASLPVSLNLMGKKPGTGKRHSWRAIDHSDASRCEDCGNEASALWLARHPDDACKPISMTRQLIEQSKDQVMTPPLTLNGRRNLYEMSGEIDPKYLTFAKSIKPKNYYSQFGEDGAIEAIFEKIGTANKWCVECGAGDGLFFSNTRRLIENGWHSVQIEADEKFFDRLQERYRVSEKVFSVRARIGVGPGFLLDDVLGSLRTPVPVDLDLLVLDIDGQEYHVISSLEKYRPRVLIVEYNPDADPMYIPEPNAPPPPPLDQAGRLAMGHVVSARGYDVICRTECNLICVRRDLAPMLLDTGAEARFVAGEWRAETDVIKDNVTVNLAIAMSTPRIGFLDSSDIITEIALAVRARRGRGFGVYWHHSLSRCVKRALEDEDADIDVIVTADYDTFATPADLIEMVRLLYENPSIDAVIPVQSKRSAKGEILIGTDGLIDWSKGLSPANTGHFGLTVFRRRVFERMAKPWFYEKPDPNGDWEDGRTDADIGFWRNFCDSGLKAALATNVVIGHREEVVAVPKIKDGKITITYLSSAEWLRMREEAHAESIRSNAGQVCQ